MPDLKVTADHLRRDAYLYIRQSTLRQVAENGESTQRQYALRHRAIAAGWPAERIHVSTATWANRDPARFSSSNAACEPGKASHSISRRSPSFGQPTTCPVGASDCAMVGCSPPRKWPNTSRSPRPPCINGGGRGSSPKSTAIISTVVCGTFLPASRSSKAARAVTLCPPAVPQLPCHQPNRTHYETFALSRGFLGRAGRTPTP